MRLIILIAVVIYSPLAGIKESNAETATVVLLIGVVYAVIYDLLYYLKDKDK